jgi:hypothetical protein
MFGDDDLTDVFYDDEATEFTLVGSSPVETFRAHMGQEDEERFQANAVGTVRLIQYPTAAVVLREGSEVSDGTVTWRVYREPRLINDGAESQTYLVPVSDD